MAGVKPQFRSLDFQNAAEILNLPDATQPQSPVTLSQLEAVRNGLSFKEAVRAASVANVTVASPGAALDGVTLAVGDRVLLKDQTDPTENGIYIFNGATIPLTRAEDAATFEQLETAVVGVDDGTVNADMFFRQDAIDGTVGVDDIIFVSFAPGVGSASETVAGVIEIATQVEVDAGTATNLAVTPATLANADFILTQFCTDFGDGTATNYTINHNLGTTDVLLAVREAGGDQRLVDIGTRVIDANNVEVCSDIPVGTGQLRICVVG